MRSITTPYVLSLSIAFILGICLVAGSAFYSVSIGESNTAALLETIGDADPQLKFDEVQKITPVVERWTKQLASESFWSIIARDFGIALLIAVGLAVSVETYARLRFQDEIRTGVLEAAFQRVIPASIFAEVRDHVIGAKCIRCDWSVAMNVYRDPSLSIKGEGYFVSQTIIRYKIFNTTNHAPKQLIAAILDDDLTGTHAAGQLPRFESISIGAETYRGERLAEHIKGTVFRTTRELSRDRAVPLEVSIVSHSILKAPDTFVWSVTDATENAEISISAPSVDEIAFKVSALHPDADRLKADVSGTRWTFGGALLPWQGFEIRSTLRASNEPPMVRNAEIPRQ